MRQPKAKLNENKFIEKADLPKDKDVSYKKTSFDCPTDLYQDIKIYCIKNDIKQKDFILSAITKYMDSLR